MFCINDKQGRGHIQFFGPGPPVTLLRYWDRVSLVIKDINKFSAAEVILLVFLAEYSAAEAPG